MMTIWSKNLLHIDTSDCTPQCPSIHPCVGWLRFTLFGGLRSPCFCPNTLVTPNRAPAHPHETWVAVYPAMFVQSKVGIGKKITVIPEITEMEEDQGSPRDWCNFRRFLTRSYNWELAGNPADVELAGNDVVGAADVAPVTETRASNKIGFDDHQVGA